MFDYQNVKLVGITKPIDLSLKAEDLVTYCARVSNPKNQKNVGTSVNLLKYLIRNEHWSPFEMVNVVMEIETTRDISRQIIRHRSFSFQEFSQRYAEVVNKFPSEDYRECRLQDEKNRQNSLDNNNEMLASHWNIMQSILEEKALKNYKWALDNGIAKEQARAVLPEGLTMSKLYMNGTLRSWIHYCLLRMGNGTQKEHQDIANKCWDLLVEEFYFLKFMKDEKFTEAGVE